jgi:hypothetical protein
VVRVGKSLVWFARTLCSGRKRVLWVAVAIGAIPLVLSGIAMSRDRFATPGVSSALDATPGPSFGLDAVSCVSASDCIAVGGSNYGFTVAERWNGSRWMAMATPRPKGSVPGGFLSGIACVSASDCIAVGQYESFTLGYLSLAEHWNGTVWAIMPMPRVTVLGSAAGASRAAVAGTNPALSGVSCVGASNCLAVGSTGFVSLVERWNGTKWTVVARPPGRGLTRVLCTGVSDCIAVGWTTASLVPPFSPVSGVYHWNGSAWTMMATPSPAGQIIAGFSDIACVSRSNCTVVGNSGSGSDVNPLAEHWNGAAWTLMSTPSPPSLSGSSFSGVACSSPSNCSAVGITEGGNYVWLPMVEHWNGTTWTIVSTPTIKSMPDAQGSTAAVFTDVACPGASTCIAVAAQNLYAAVWKRGALVFWK